MKSHLMSFIFLKSCLQIRVPSVKLVVKCDFVGEAWLRIDVAY